MFTFWAFTGVKVEEEGMLYSKLRWTKGHQGLNIEAFFVYKLNVHGEKDFQAGSNTHSPR
jgi:hypothetical protein